MVVVDDSILADNWLNTCSICTLHKKIKKNEETNPQSLPHLIYIAILQFAYNHYIYKLLTMQTQIETNQIKAFHYQQTQQWLNQLHNNGVVVIKNVLTQDQVATSIDLFWQWLQSLGTEIKKTNPDTWDNQNWPGMSSLGFFGTYGGCHNKASWFIRSQQKVRGAFAKIWKTDNLITSFDTFIGWKPWWVHSKWKPIVENLHCDQNPFFKKGLKCVQGMVPLKRVRANQVGGLMVVPKTNNDETQKYLCSKYQYLMESSSDWVQLPESDPYIKENKGVLVQCEAGDLILWDSRTIHGGKICQPSKQFMQENTSDLVRLSMTVTMVPREWASSQVLKKRIEIFNDKVGLTHWPHEINKSGMGGYLKGVITSQIKYDWPTLQGAVKQLV